MVVAAKGVSVSVSVSVAVGTVPKGAQPPAAPTAPVPAAAKGVSVDESTSMAWGCVPLDIPITGVKQDPALVPFLTTCLEPTEMFLDETSSDSIQDVYHLVST